MKNEIKEKKHVVSIQTKVQQSHYLSSKLPNTVPHLPQFELWVKRKVLDQDFPRSCERNATGQCVIELYLSATILRLSTVI